MALIHRCRFVHAAAALFCGLIPAGAQAGVITGVISFEGPGLQAQPFLAPMVFTAAPDNDPAAISINSVAFISPIDFGAVDYVDITFAVADSNGVTQYAIAMLLNNASTDVWLSYELLLGFDAPGGFQPAGGTNLDFNAADITRQPDSVPTSSSFNTYSYDEDRIWWYDGSYSWDTIALLSADIDVDVPNSSEIPGADAGGYEFTIRVIPHAEVIPEPAAALWSFATLALMFTRRRGIGRG